MIFHAQWEEGNSLIKVLFIFNDCLNFFFPLNILLTGLLSFLEGKACKRLHSASSRLRRSYRAMQDHTGKVPLAFISCCLAQLHC